MPWSGEHRGFAVRTYFENGRSVIATQRAFRLHFNIPRHGPIPDGKAIRRWIEALEDNGSTRRPRGSGRPKKMFPARLVSRRDDVEWPPHSPDLSICNFFLWGYLKEKVFRAENFRHRLQQCIATEGHHLPDAIFKK
ncbi:hypothetical protein O3P69_001754 [Scylla paramamosain]|uniref:DUF4817 domain-containing protein n=1 Tax=Scylla paramamosain TaxID=85552 RepID=A0AAW0UZ84_SCYPA